ncbi:MAG: methionyl-tRNA formyltransferase [Bacteroidales bacterium]|nr:methionyl-tRNA formyltransferase [Bacteroidales bacterium]MDZ4203739.1 methionyl-tRNA formyltransferase [Bacteroidales bacterium]
MKDRQDFRIVFMGTPDFAVPSLRVLHEASYTISAVVTAPDKPQGRGLKLKSSPVKEFALQLKLPVLQPPNLKDKALLTELMHFNADLFVVAAFRMLPEKIWAMPEFGCINLHASLLPQYRGAAPINWAIINGEATTGVSTFFIEREIDTGHIIMQESVDIQPDETAGELHYRLMLAGASLLLKTVDAIRQGNAEITAQKILTTGIDTLKMAPKIHKTDCRINWTWPTATIHNFIRGLSPYPGAYTRFVSSDGKIYDVKIYKSKLCDEHFSSPPGKLIVADRNTRLFVNTADGWIELLEMQIQGKTRMTVHALLRGTPIANDWNIE